MVLASTSMSYISANLDEHLSRLHLNPAPQHNSRPHRFDPLQSYLDILQEKRVVNFERATKTTHDFADDEACPICYETLDTKLPARRTVCGHTYCQDCIARWLAHNVRCPTCNYHLPG
jgi:hypothetical protein